MLVTSSVSSQLVQDGDHPGLGRGELGLGVVPVLQRPPDPFERAGSVGHHPGGVGQGREQGAHDPQARSDLAAAGDLRYAPRARTGPHPGVGCGPGPRRRGPSPRSSPRPTWSSGTGAWPPRGRRATRTPAGRGSAARTARAPRSAARGGRRGAAADPRSHRPVRAGSSAAARSAGRSAPRPCRRSCPWSGPRSCAPTTTTPAAHTRTTCPGPRRAGPAPATGARSARTPTVTPANPARVARPAAQSNAAPRSHALHRNVRRASTLESWSVTTTICLRSARSIPTIAFVTGTAARSRESRAFRFRSPRETPLPLFMNVLLLAHGTPSPTSASGGRSPRQTRRRSTPSYAAIRSHQHAQDSAIARWTSPSKHQPHGHVSDLAASRHVYPDMAHRSQRRTAARRHLG